MYKIKTPPNPQNARIGHVKNGIQGPHRGCRNQLEPTS
jgi:hypothetical protein